MCSTQQVQTSELHTADSKPCPLRAKSEKGSATHLNNPMADGAVLSLPQHHQADDYDRSNGHRNDQQANEGTAAQTEVLPQLRHRFLKQQGRCVTVPVTMGTA